MNLYKNYTLEELHEGIGRFTFIDNKRNYKINYATYKKRLRDDPLFPEKLRDWNLEVREAHKLHNELYLLLIHILEIPIEEVPLYTNSWFKEVQALCLFRLEQGK
jgi:hypothetical protein